MTKQKYQVLIIKKPSTSRELEDELRKFGRDGFQVVNSWITKEGGEDWINVLIQKPYISD